MQVPRVKEPPKIKFEDDSSDEEEVQKPDFWELTSDNNPGNPKEKKRILRCGGEVRPPKQFMTKDYI